MSKRFEWKCLKCKKIISSLYKKQFIYNKEQHIEAHKRKAKKPIKKRKTIKKSRRYK